MGTRSLTVMLDENGKEIAVLYRQMDGYPSGHGMELKEFLGEDRKVVNGINVGGGDERNFNGPYCLAAQLVAHFKNGIGDFYLYPAGTRDAGEEYIYTVKPEQDGTVSVTVVDTYHDPLLKGKDGPLTLDEALEQEKELSEV